MVTVIENNSDSSDSDKEIKEEPRGQDQTSSDDTIKSEPEETWTFGQQPTESVKIKGSVKSASTDQPLEIIDLDNAQEAQSIQAVKDSNKDQNQPSIKQASQVGQKGRLEKVNLPKDQAKSASRAPKIPKKPEPEEEKHSTDEKDTSDEMVIVAPAEPKKQRSFTMVLRSASKESTAKKESDNSVGGSDSEDTKSLLDSPEEDEKVEPVVKKEPKTFDYLDRTNAAVHDMYKYVNNLVLQRKLEKKNTPRYKTIIQRHKEVLPEVARMRCQTDVQLSFAQLAASMPAKISANFLRRRNKELTSMGIGEKLTVGKVNKTLEVFAKIAKNRNCVKYLMDEFFDEHFDNYWQMMTQEQRDTFSTESKPKETAPPSTKEPANPPPRREHKRKVGRPKKKKQTPPNPDRPVTRSRSKIEHKDEPKKESVEVKEEAQDE